MLSYINKKLVCQGSFVTNSLYATPTHPPSPYTQKPTLYTTYCHS